MSAYEVIVKWRRNLFELPKGASGKAFVTTVCNLIDAWCNKTDKREYALYGIAIMPNLLLQKTNSKVTGKENKETLTRRLEMWNSGKITELLREGEALQRRLPKSNGGKSSIAEKAKRLKNLVIEDKTSKRERERKSIESSIQQRKRRKAQKLTTIWNKCRPLHFHGSLECRRVSRKHFGRPTLKLPLKQGPTYKKE